MEETNVQALETIFTEVDESQIKIIFSNQCIKAQAFLVDKLRKQTKHQKEICNLISSGNIKLDAEIKLAEQEIKNLIIAHDTIKLGNVELRKECLLKISEKLEILERINTGEQKYEHLWLESKNRFESIPFIQKYLQVKNRNIKVIENKKTLIDESRSLMCEIKIKKDELQQLDQTMIIDLANFFVKQRPQIVDTILKKMKEIDQLNQEITILEEKGLKSIYPKRIKAVVSKPSQQTEKTQPQTTCNVDNSWPTLSKNENDGLLMPKLQLQGMDLDILSIKLDQIRKVDLYAEQQKEPIMIERFKRDLKPSEFCEEHSRSYFNEISVTLDNDNKSKNYSERKLIHILKDVKLENHQTMEIISKVNPDQLSNVKAISSEGTDVENSENKVGQALPIEKEVHGGKRITELLVPPTQFLDERKCSQEVKMSFDISLEIADDTGKGHSSVDKKGEGNGTLKRIDIDSIVSHGEEDRKMQDKVVIEDKLDSSQYSCNEHSILHKMTHDKIVTSKFFDPKMDSQNQSSDCEETDCADTIDKVRPKSKEMQQEKNTIIKVSSNMKINEVILPTTSQDYEKVDLPVSGFLFNHGSQGVPDSLNLSESTQGFEDADGDLPHCIDSNILLSPKADITLDAVDDNVQVSSQKLSGFMSGVRKSGLGLFGWSLTDSKEKSNAQNADSNFNFNFVGEEKKGRGGLFNMFR